MYLTEQKCTTKVPVDSHLCNERRINADSSAIGLSIPTELTAHLIIRRKKNGEGAAFIHQPSKQRERVVDCAHCGDKFQTLNSRAKYCCDACRAAATRERVKAGAVQKRRIQDGINRNGRSSVRIGADCFEMMTKDEFFRNQHELTTDRFDNFCRFITLTFRGIFADDKTSKRLLDNFFKRLRRHRGHNVHYIWVAEIQVERQKKTGERVIHFHILTIDRIMKRSPGEAWQHWRMRENNWINFHWNCVVANWAHSAGRITAKQHTQWIEETKAFCRYYRDLTLFKLNKSKVKPSKLAKSDFMLLPNHLYIKNAGRYMAKYMSKMGEQIAGNLWGISTESRQFLNSEDKVKYNVRTTFTGNAIIDYMASRASQDGVFVATWELEYNETKGVWCKDTGKLMQWYFEWLELYGKQVSASSFKYCLQ